MAIFGSYLDKNHTLLGESVNVIILDTFVAVTAGLIIFPACFTFGVEVNAGPSLLFDTMATVFNHMAGGRLWGTLFFLFMIFAALSTELAVFENILACVREITGWNRVKGSVICGIGMFLLSLTTALGFTALSGCLLAQSQKSVNIDIGSGMVTIALASLLIGNVFMGRRKMPLRIFGMVIGAFVFRLVYTVALRFNMPAFMLKLVSSVIVVAAISIPYLKEQLPLYKRKLAQRNGRRAA